MYLFNKILKLTSVSKKIRFFTTSSNLLNPLIPIVIDQTGVGERSYDIFSRLLKDRIICLMGGVSDESASLIIAQLLFLQSESQKAPIHMYINSPGTFISIIYF